MARLGLRANQGRAAEGGVTLPYPPLEGEGRQPKAAGWGDRNKWQRDHSTASQVHPTPALRADPPPPGEGEESKIMAPKVLISDALSDAAVQIFKDRGIEVDFQPKLGADKDKLAELIENFDGLAIRSATKVTGKLLDRAKKLKVIGRAGIGVDNVDIPAATAKGVIVMNTPFGNSITTAEHAITLMLALARQIPQADASTQAGKWEKNRFLGVEITGKTLGIIGCGNIGSIVADRAHGLRMKVLAFDPFLSPERALDLGVDKVELPELFRRSDFITLHTPLTDKTKNIIDGNALATMKKSVRIINCARGGLVDEAALRAALDKGQVAGAAFDVFTEEPANANPLFGHPNVVCTPHLGAATSEAQENVALQVAEQMSDYLLTGAISNAVNFPSITAEEAPKLKPFVALAEKLGSFAGQLTETGINKVQIAYEGNVAQMNTKALTSAAIAGLLRPMLQNVNVVSAPIVAKERGIVVEEMTREAAGDYDSLITVTVETEKQSRFVSGTIFADGRPRIVNIKGIRMDAEFGQSMIYITNLDKPGFIGKFSSTLGDAGINIATFHVGRVAPGGNAVALIEIDGELPPAVLTAVRALPQVQLAKPLKF
jgi:D-3-phosphoglycerate dehydrogenase